MVQDSDSSAARKAWAEAERGGVGTSTVESLAGTCPRRQLVRGETLIQAGTSADRFYLVRRGRLHVFVGDRPIAEIARGEPVGEIAFFAGGTRTADVVAARSAEVIEIDREQWKRIVVEEPDLTEALLGSLSRRLGKSVAAVPRLNPRPARIIGILPAGDHVIAPDRVRAILDAITRDGEVAHVPASEMNGQFEEHVEKLASEGKRVVISAFDVQDVAQQGVWAETVAAQSDLVLLLADPEQGSRVSALEQSVMRMCQPQAVHLAILHKGDAIGSGPAMLQDRAVGLHHHLRNGNSADLARLARFVRGEALGVVFSGGGAYGTAQLALIKALSEAGIAPDLVGGTSIGSAMAGICAMGLAPDEVMRRIDQMFVRSGAMRRLTVPKYSIIDHFFFDQELQKHFEAYDIENLEVPFFAAATSLTTNDLRILRRGPLWRAVRASSAIPAVFPPMVLEDGDVLVDGAYIDNAPIEPMRQIKAGPNLVLSINKTTDWRVETPYESLPGRRQQLLGMFMGPFRRRVRFPGIASIMARSMSANAERRLAMVERRDDVFVALSPLPRMGFLDWKRSEELYDSTYAKASEILSSMPSGTSPGDMLEALARRIGP